MYAIRSYYAIPPMQFEIGLVDSGFMFSMPKKITRSTPEMEIEVMDLPGVAKNLPVGDFGFEVETDKIEVDVNDILALKIKIRGNGNVKTVNPLEAGADALKDVRVWGTVQGGRVFDAAAL